MRRGLRVAVIAGVVAAACGGTSSPTSPTPASTYTISATELADMTAEKAMGGASAPVTIIEYSSLTCPHCATFHTAPLPVLKTTYIDSGKVRYVYRDFPVPGASTQAAAYAAAALARCAGSGRYFEALDLLYRAQASWTSAGNPNTAMKQTVAALGMPAEKTEACMASAGIQNEITRVMNEGRTTYGLTGTPTFLVNGQKYTGAPSLAEWDAMLKTLLQ
jgi:protein-disulfide isomerase